MANTITIIAGIVVIVLVIGALVFLLGGHQPSATTTVAGGSTSAPTTVSPSGSSQTPIVMTDPPSVPSGTSALVMSYSNVKVQSTDPSTYSSAWVNAQGSGSADLTTLNSSDQGQVIGWANVTTNSDVNAVQYTITSAQITVNGTTYNVTLPANSTVTAQTSGSARVNSSTSVIVNTAPTVTASTNSSTDVTTYTWSGTNAQALVYSNSTFAANARLNVDATVKLNTGIWAQISSVLGITI